MKKWIGFGAGVLAGLCLLQARRRRQQLVIGFPDEWRLFSKRNPRFVQAVPALIDVMNAVLMRPAVLDNLPDRIVHFLSKVIGVDFLEVFILCGNGQGIGGLKIIRGMYERVVTLSYIAKNPSEAERFWNYGAIHKYKMLVHANGIMDIDRFITKEVQAAAKADRDAVKTDYMDQCEKCGHQRPLPSWIKGGIDTLASKTSEELKQRYLYCYYWPTLHDHATANNIIERLEIGPDDVLRWKDDAQRWWADVAISSAHGLMLDVLDLNNSRFSLGFNSQIDGLGESWRRAWLTSPKPAT